MDKNEVSLRDSLEQAAIEIESVASDAPPIEDAPPMDSSENTEDPSLLQSQDDTAQSSDDATEPVGDDPSNEGSVAPSGDEVKDITEVVEDTTSTVGEQTGADTTSSASPQVDAPTSWKPEIREEWSNVPPKVQEEILRREQHIVQALNETAVDRKRVDEISQVLAPHQDLIQASYGGNPMQAIHGLLNTERTLSSGNTATKAQVVAKIINDFGVDLQTLDSVLAGQELPPDTKQQSEVDRVIAERMAPVNQFIQQQQIREQTLKQQQADQFKNVIQEMVQNTTEFPYFNEVRSEMADIIEFYANKGVDVSLEEAYDKATRLNGRTSEIMDTKQTTQAQTEQALKAHQEAQKAKGASVSVVGNPTSVGTEPPKNTDLRSLISDALNTGGDRV